MRVEVSDIVNRPIDDVFRFLSEPERHPLWVGAVLDDSQQSPGPVHEGTTFHEEAKLLGRKLGADWTVTRYEPPHFYEQETRIGSAHMRISFTLTQEGEGTRVDQVSEGESVGIFRLADSVVARVLRNQQQADLDNLKLILESQSDGPLGES